MRGRSHLHGRHEVVRGACRRGELLSEGDHARVRALGQLELLRGVACARGAALAAQPTHRPAAPQSGDRPLPRPASAEALPLVEQRRPVRIALEETVLLTYLTWAWAWAWGEGKTQSAPLLENKSPEDRLGE